MLLNLIVLGSEGGSESDSGSSSSGGSGSGSDSDSDTDDENDISDKKVPFIFIKIGFYSFCWNEKEQLFFSVFSSLIKPLNSFFLY